MTDQIKKYPENYMEEEKTGLRCPMCGAEVNEGQIFCIECGADLRKAAQNAETELNDVYGGPEYFEKPARKTRTERVYAGPEPYKKPDAESMQMTYAGPEAYNKPEPSPMEGVYAGPEYFNNPDTAPMEAVYAGPEYFNKTVKGIDVNNMAVLYGPPEVLFRNAGKKDEEKPGEPDMMDDKKPREPDMKVLYAAPAPRKSLAQKIKGILKK